MLAGITDANQVAVAAVRGIAIIRNRSSPIIRNALPHRQLEAARQLHDFSESLIRANGMQIAAFSLNLPDSLESTRKGGLPVARGI